MASLYDSAPRVESLGTRDLSQRVVPTDFQNLPQHLPKFYIFSEKGPTGHYYVNLSEHTLIELYGTETFNIESKYYTHSTPFIEKTAAAANNMVVHRLIPTDAKDVANIALYLDVLPSSVPLYEKNSDGSISRDSNGNPIQKLDTNGDPVTVSGYKVKWVTDYTVATTGTYQRGLLTQRVGTQIDTVTNTQSIQYPVFEFAAADVGEYGNRLAIRLWPAMQTDIDPFPELIFNDIKNYPYYFQLYKLTDNLTGNMEVIYNNLASVYNKFTLDPTKRDPASGDSIDLGYVVNARYIEQLNGYKNDLGTVYVYNNNLTTLLTQFYNAEKVTNDPYRDSLINSIDNNIYALNILSFTSSNGSPYNAIKLVDSTDSMRLTKNTNVFLKGAFDGTMDEHIFDQLVRNDLVNYSNSLHPYQDLVKYPESIIYDTGFKLATKKALGHFISKRKDTFIVGSTYAFNAPSLTTDEQYSVAVALKTTYQLYPESVVFGTQTMRACILSGSGHIVESNYKKRVPLAYDFLYKAARYMGASNAKWKNGFLFDKEPNSIITEIKNIDVTWIPSAVRSTMWSVGITFPLNFEIRRQFFPAVRTIYENNTSVLNNFFTAMAIAYLNKIAHAAWRKFTGSISLTNAQLEEQVNKFVEQAVADRFDNLFVIKPNATVTEMDALRGYSWTLPIKIYANNMKTVLETYVEAYRMEDLQR